MCRACTPLIWSQVILMSYSGSFNSASVGILWYEECWHLKKLKDIVLCIPWGGTRTFPQGCTIVSWLPLPCLWIPSLPGLATVRICPLERREGHEGWSQEMGDRKASVPRSPTGSCLVSLWDYYIMVFKMR